MIKSSNVSLKFANPGKLTGLSTVLDEYRRVVGLFVDMMWDMTDVKSFVSKDLVENIDTWLSSRMIQCAGKQASGIVRGTRTKQKKREWMIKDLTQKGEITRAAKLQKIYDETKVSKPAIASVKPELDSRFVKVELGTSGEFDGWITLSSIGRKTKIVLPFRKTAHLNKLLAEGTRTNGVRITDNKITFMINIPDPAPRDQGTTIGIDMGLTTAISCSNGFVSTKNRHGYDLSTITKIVERRKPGSSGMRRAADHRLNYTNWTINQLPLSGVQELRMERLRDVRRRKRTSRSLRHWTYADIAGKLRSTCLQRGVRVVEVDPAYTSRRCSKCGWVQKTNRHGKLFRCASCGFTADADLNASVNIACPLVAIGHHQECPPDKFFWNLPDGHEPIVRDTRRPLMSEMS